MAHELVLHSPEAVVHYRDNRNTKKPKATLKASF
jgi:hypothetical protein